VRDHESRLPLAWWAQRTEGGAMWIDEDVDEGDDLEEWTDVGGEGCINA
jgi:hypothetical protein